MTLSVQLSCQHCGGRGYFQFPSEEERKLDPGWVWGDAACRIRYDHAQKCVFFVGCRSCGSTQARLTDLGTAAEWEHVAGCEELLPKRPMWSDIYMRFAQDLSKRSTCSRLQVGCVVVSGDNQRVLAIGYNGNYRGGPNRCDSEEPGACGCIHAEANAMVKFDPREAGGAVLYTTDSPCRHCAKLIVNSGIRVVMYDRLYRKPEETVRIFSEASVAMFRYQN